MIESIEELKDRLTLWQRRLGLSDWEISVKFCDGVDINQNQGTTRLYRNTQKAIIRLMKPEDRQLSDPNDSDIELDLIHELIHVRLWAIDPDNPDPTMHTCREQAVEWIAKALLETERNKKEQK